MHTFRIRTYISLLTVAYFGLSATASAASIDHASTISRFVNDDTFFVGYVDMASLPATENPAQLIFAAAYLPQEVQDKFIGIAIIAGLIKQFQDAGGQGFYTVLGLADVNSIGGPVLVATSRADRNPDDLAQLCRNVIKSIADDPNQVALMPVANSLVVRRVDNAILVGTPSVVDRYESLKASPRADLTQPLATMTAEDVAIAAVFSPGPDFRRVVRELWPQFPPPLEKFRGELADRWLRLEFTTRATTNHTMTLTLQTTDREAAETFVELAHAVPAAVDEFEVGGKKQAFARTKFETILKVLPMQIDGTSVRISLPTDDTQMTTLKSLLTDASNASMESTRRRQRMNSFKQLALAMLNYHDVHKQFPPRATRNKDGQPLLSWRVAILPYLEDGTLYKQFHLDEPWDSPHNLALVKQMPDVFADPAHKDLAREGKTTYVAPIAPGTVFDSDEGITFKEITDGTSKTILFVEAPIDRAVIWTKPGDLEVDLENPLRELQRPDRDSFIAAYCDGHVSTIDTDADPAKLRAALIRNDGEVVDLP